MLWQTVRHVKFAVQAFPDGESGISEKSLGFVGDGEAALHQPSDF